MWLIDLEAPPAHLRGLLARWSVEVRAGLYVGSTGARVRDQIWALVCTELTTGNAVLVYDARNTQGFDVRTAGVNRREIVNVDGLSLAKFLPSQESVPWDDPNPIDVDAAYVEDG
ncbi:MAG: type I-E CRISPR-associated endoribonuclease Cas2e [Polyangiaceae bacterium]|jgi:CRISPR-associated protein Cas2